MMKTIREYLREIRLEMESEKKHVDAKEMQDALIARLPSDHPWLRSVLQRAARRAVDEYCQSLITLEGKRSHHQTMLLTEDGDERSIYAEPDNMSAAQVKSVTDDYASRVRSVGRAALDWRDLVLASGHKRALKTYVQSSLKFIDDLLQGNDDEAIAS